MPRSEPAADDPQRRAQTDQQQREREPGAERTGEVRRAAHVARTDSVQRLTRDKTERDRLIGSQPVQPERGNRIARDRDDGYRSTPRDHESRLNVAG